MRNLSSCRPFNWSMGQRSSGLEWILKRPGMPELRMCALASAILKKTLQEESKSAAVLISRYRIPLFMASSPVLDGIVFLLEETPPNSSNNEGPANRFDGRAPGHYARAVYAKDAASLKLNANIFDVRSEGQEAYGVLAANKASLS